MKTALIITIRMKSSRLPRKALLKIKGKTIFEHLIDRMKLAKRPDMVIVATSTHPDDAILAEIAEKSGVKYFRGSPEDKLARYVAASKKFGFDYMVDVTGDNPFSDTEYIDKIIEEYEKDNKSDFILVDGLPLGTAPIGLKMSTVEKICKIKTGSDTEAYGYYFLNTNLFNVKHLKAEKCVNRPDIRLTIDYQEDFELAKKIFEELGENKNTFALSRIIEIFNKKPELLEINQEAQKKYEENFVRIPKAQIKHEFKKYYKKSDLEGEIELRKIQIGNKILDSSSCLIIAEAGVNHNGDIKKAKRMIDIAKEAGADAIKFQTFKAEKMITKNAPKAKYQIRNTEKDSSQYEMLKKLELSKEEFKELYDYAKRKEILFLSTPFDFESVDFLESLGVSAFKISSADLTNLPLLEHVAKKRKPMIISTGMATFDEISEAIDAIKSTGNEEIVLLHCTTDYPAKFESLNLKVIPALEKTFKLHVGFSDHSPGIYAPLMAIAMGAILIEKHFTLDKNLDGPDHKASLNPDELKKLVKAVRLGEKALGDGIKKPLPEEEENKKIARKSIVANMDIPKGGLITRESIDFKRPGTGLAPKEYKKILNKKAKRNIKKDEMILQDDVE